MDSQKSRDPRCRIYRSSCRPPLCDRACDALAAIRGPQGLGNGVWRRVWRYVRVFGIAALLSFFASVSLITYQRFFGVRTGLPVTEAISEPLRRRVRNPAIITLTGWVVLIASAKFGTAAVFLVGIPAVLVASAIAGGARSPAKIPLRDAILYVGISVAIVVGILVYAMYHH